MVRVEVFGDKELIAKLERSKALLDSEKPALLTKIGGAMQMNIRDQIWRNFNQRTGKLFNSVRVFNQTKNGISVGTGKGIDYVQPLEFGSIPHRITAGFSTQAVFSGDVGHYRFVSTGGASMLHFINSYGEEVFARSVDHPGNRPYRFIYGGFLGSMPQVYGYCRRYVATALQVPM